MGFLFGLILLVLDLWAILNVFRSSAGTVEKLAWGAGILIFPLLGLIVWFMAGPKDQKLLPRR